MVPETTGNVHVMPLMTEVDGRPLVKVSGPSHSTVEKENDLPGSAAQAGSCTGLIPAQQPTKMNRSLREKLTSWSWTPALRPAHHQLPSLGDTTSQIRLSRVPTSTSGVCTCPARQTCFMSPRESEGSRGENSPE